MPSLLDSLNKQRQLQLGTRFEQIRVSIGLGKKRSTAIRCPTTSFRALLKGLGNKIQEYVRRFARHIIPS